MFINTCKLTQFWWTILKKATAVYIMSVLAIKPTFVNTKFKTSQWVGLNEPPVPGITEWNKWKPALLKIIWLLQNSRK